MSVTPGKGRLSGIPTPGKPGTGTGIPTPGLRPRSTSSTGQRPSMNNQDDDYANRAFQDAIRANDPAQHRAPRAGESHPPSSFASSLSPSSSSSSASIQSLGLGFSHNGARLANLGASVGGVRPSSSASSASSAGRTPSAKASAVRPPSRQSDVFTRSASRAGRPFDVDDNVRIESLGFEGVLRYFGEIDGKPGMWAGVELSGGFVGKGKNNGSVAGKQYFTCPPNCGVFVASTKLSASTVGITYSRPSSVASSRSGRMTPSFSSSGRMTPSALPSFGNGRKTPSISNGRVTPSISNGRVTPGASTGRKTPSLQTPSARPRTSTVNTRTLVTPARNTNVPTNITPGSRAAKYVGMTAKQLSGPPQSPKRGAGSASPSRSTGFGSLVQAVRQLASPTRGARSTPGSPFTTPKALGAPRPSGIGMGLPTSTTPSKSRPSTSNTPRARLPSAIAMPPPPSPSNTTLSSRSVSLNGPQTPVDLPGSLSDLEMNAKAIQDRISGLMSSRKTPSSPRPDSRVSASDSLQLLDLQGHVERLQARLDAAEDENNRLRTRTDGAEREASSRIEALVAERDRHASRISELETASRTAERTLSERETQIEAHQRAAEQAARDIEKARVDGETRLRDAQSKLRDKEALVAQLKEAVEAREGEQNENAALLKAKNAEIALLEARVQKVSAELEEERRELGGHVDELRMAGQETIALYEERLSAADTKRYELEDMVVSLEEQLRTQARPVSPGTVARQATSAVEIDNEMLRDQVQHLQKKIGTLEDTLEDMRTANEHEDVAVRERIKRYKEREDAIRKELAEGRQEVDRVRKGEEKARIRTEEVEEALRENTIALENARAEVETLRNEIADLEGLAAAAASNSTDKLGELAPRANAERAKLQEELTELRQQLAQAQAATPSAGSSVQALEDELYSLRGDREMLQESLKRTQAELADERAIVEELRVLANERTVELDNMRKKLNRDGSVNGYELKAPVSPSSKHDLAAARDEITGLKHIVQELQKENGAFAQRSKVLESENKLLLSETEQLRDDLKALEEDVEKSLAREEAMLSGEQPPSPPTPSLDDVQALQRSYKDLKSKYETEVEQLRKKLADIEMKSARQVHDLNKEIGELESLIESKIYREDELEREIERLKDKLSRSQKKSSKTDLPLPEDSTGRPPSVASTMSSTVGQSDEVVCEICERPGHDIFTCDLLKEDAAPPSAGLISSSLRADSELICEDCEERGHTAANCPHSLDVF
ncbi:hypothetical protein LXA43DRAFT_723290 [Ganoderma leucocontextum]|nr:hypothetical protein LXA43DRAFT_723290 [Ganoderma leucocontextum]